MTAVRTFAWAMMAVILTACVASSDQQALEYQQLVSRMKVIVTASGGREVELVVTYPGNGCKKCTLILFSHGANATPDRYDALLNVWAAAGYVVAAPMHVDSEEYADRDAFQPSSYLPLRIEDIELSALTLMQQARVSSAAFSLSGKYVAAGHSFGALIAQIAGGARPHEKSGADRINLTNNSTAVIAISPPPEIPDYIDALGWSSIAVPMLIITGTRDTLPGFVDDWEQHLDSYEAAPAGISYAAIFTDMDHYFNGAFGRLNEDGQPNALPALDKMNELVLEFIDHSSRGEAITPEQWIKQSDTIAVMKRAEIKVK